ncbi:MAG: DNA polymerase III subunit gamma/tau [Ruminococcus sp.]|nr:DNA polymerase III subunit gamma/tau [Ruminococcus sp.]
MSVLYQVLYRKWRPQKFEDVYGQPQVTRTLQNELKNNRVNHAYLFTGSRGTGKTTCAKILAKAVNCLDLRDGDPCCECENCRGIDDGSILDVVEMDAASNRGIDDIREVIDEAQFRPARAKFRVYIIDEVHMLTDQAFNALLKTLEEPPEHVIFILATTEVHKLPATILSRCQRFDFNRIAPEEITKRLRFVAEQENASIDDDAAMLIAAIADGAMRDALSLMDRCLGSTDKITTEVVRNSAGLAAKDYLFELSASCINKNTAKALDIVTKLHNESKDMARLCDELLDHFRSLMLIKTTRNPRAMIVMSEDEFEEAQTQADYLSLAEIVYIMDVLQNAYSRMGKGNSNRTELEMALVKLSAPELEGTNEALTARVSALEKAVKSGIKIEQKPEPKQAPEKVEPKPLPKPEPKTAEDKSEKPRVMPEPKPAEPEEKPVPSPITEPEPKKSAPAPEPPKKLSVDLEELYNNAQPFRQWPEVVDNIKKYSKGIAAAFDNTNAYISGNYLLIDAKSEIPFRLLKQGSQRANVRKAIQEITGEIYKLGPYRKPEKKEEKKDPLNDLINELKESGIDLKTEE